MAFSFGSSNAAPSATPNAPASSPFSFGGAPKPQQQQQQPGNAQQGRASGSGTGLFGFPQSQPQQQQQTGASSSLFGNAPQQQQQQPATSSLFGNTLQQPQPPQQTSSLFGTPQNSLFGNQTQQPQQQQQQQQQQIGGGLFGAPKSVLGQSAQQSNPLTLSQLGGPSSYQQQQQNQQQNRNGLFGTSAASSSANAFGQSSAQSSAAGQDVKRLGVPVNEKLAYIHASWDLQNLQTCQFLYYFYNALPSEPQNLGELAMRDPNFGRRPDAIGQRHDGLWLQTLRENPDRSKLVPVLAVGFGDLKARIDGQQAESDRQSAKLSELQKRLDGLTAKHTLSNSVRISAISRKQTSLHHQLVGLAKRIHLLIPALRGHSITLKEEQLKSLLHTCEMELEAISGASETDGGAHHHRLRGRINELWALLGTLRAKREAAQAANNGQAPVEWAVVDESAINDVVKILASQQQGLDHLTSTLQTDVRVLDTIIKGLEGVELIGVR